MICWANSKHAKRDSLLYIRVLPGAGHLGSCVIGMLATGANGCDSTQQSNCMYSNDCPWMCILMSTVM